MSEPINIALVSKPDLRDHVRAALTSARVRVLVSIAVAGLLALLYLSQVAAVNAASGQLATLRDQSIQLQRQDADLHQQLGAVTSPAYVDGRARAMGLAPAPAGASVVVTLPGTAGAGGQP